MRRVVQAVVSPRGRPFVSPPPLAGCYRARAPAPGPHATTSSSSSSTIDNDNNSHHGHRDQETAASQEQADTQLLYTAGIGMDSHLLWNDALMDSYAWGAAAPSMIVPPPSSPVWDYCCSDSLWGIGDDEVEYKKMLAVAGAS